MARPTFDASIALDMTADFNAEFRRHLVVLRESVAFLASTVGDLHPNVRSTFDKVRVPESEVIDGLQQTLDESVLLRKDLQALLQLLERNAVL